MEVTLVEMMPQVLGPVSDPNRVPMLRKLKALGVDINVNSKIMEVTDHAVKIARTDEADREEWLEGFDYVLFGLGARNYDPISEEAKEFVPEVYAIGDAVRARQASFAFWEGFDVAYNL